MPTFLLYGELQFTSTAKRTRNRRRVDSMLAARTDTAPMVHPDLEAAGWVGGMTDVVVAGLPSLRIAYGTTSEPFLEQVLADIATQWDNDGGSWWASQQYGPDDPEPTPAT